MAFRDVALPALRSITGRDSAMLGLPPIVDHLFDMRSLPASARGRRLLQSRSAAHAALGQGAARVLGAEPSARKRDAGRCAGRATPPSTVGHAIRGCRRCGCRTGCGGRARASGLRSARDRWGRVATRHWRAAPGNGAVERPPCRHEESGDRLVRPHGSLRRRDRLTADHVRADSDRSAPAGRRSTG